MQQINVILPVASADNVGCFQSSPKKLSSLIPYRDARTPVMNTLPIVSISARIRVSVAISWRPVNRGSRPGTGVSGTGSVHAPCFWMGKLNQPKP